MKISTDERFMHCVEYLCKKFNGKIEQINQRYVLHLKSNVNHYRLFDCIVSQIVTTMKSFYLQSKLKLKNKTLIKILLNYDKKADTIIAGTLFQLTPELLLDSVYDFCLTRLKYRWDEVIQLVNENYVHLSQKVLFNELLRFLILNMDYRMSEAHVMAINHKATICDQKLQPLPQNDEDIVNALIEVAPRQIFIHTSSDLTKEIVERIETLFPNCVCIEYNAVL